MIFYSKFILYEIIIPDSLTFQDWCISYYSILSLNLRRHNIFLFLYLEKFYSIY